MSVLPPHLKDLSPKERREFEQSVLKMLTVDTISLLLEDLGISQKELARRMGSSSANVSRLLSGSQNLKLTTIASMCYALGVRLEPQLRGIERAGTPAENDPPLPSWVDGSDANIQRYAQDLTKGTSLGRQAREEVTTKSWQHTDDDHELQHV